MPAAQFSVSKYQLMPHIGVVAARTAAKGRPICRPDDRRPQRVSRLPQADGETEAVRQPSPHQTPAPGMGAAPFSPERHHGQACTQGVGGKLQD
jgi:hypothetical protein